MVQRELWKDLSRRICLRLWVFLAGFLLHGVVIYRRLVVIYIFQNFAILILLVKRHNFFEIRNKTSLDFWDQILLLAVDGGDHVLLEDW